MTKLLGLMLASILTFACIALAPLLQPNWLLSVLIIPFSLVLFLIHDTKYASISLIALAVLYGLGWLSLFVFASTLAIVVFGELAFRAGGEGKRSYLYHIVAATAASLPVMVYLDHLTPLIVLMGVVVAALLDPPSGNATTR